MKVENNLSPADPRQAHIRSDRVSQCAYPDRYGCRGCEHSFNPALFDGGCRLAFDSEYRRAHERNSGKGGA